ncbi:MAG TPA: Gfo/Idh/MocA family oxidoreductase [Candidatus Dormibacteraeota bacterium]|nr:Gfo/Idh/MocA family oxidoreductase [Candidatus Dormibacteraeota bacterium]
MGRLKVGVVGCGLIAQVMHLHYLRELSDRFEIAALCDVSEETRDACAREYGVTETYSDWQELVRRPLDAVMVLTSGSHAPVAIAAAQAGIHVFVEKPMCLSIAEGQAMVDAADRAGVTLMVGYNKRYDPAYRRLLDEKPKLADLRLLRITTLESPIAPYVQHYPLHRGAPPAKEIADALNADTAARIAHAVPDADPLSRWAYHAVLLDSLVHELNAMRGAMGEPDRLEFADIRETGLTAVFTYGAAQAILAWVDLPTIARYSMEFAFYSPEKRLTLSFPSPFLRSMPTLLITEDGAADSPRSTRTEEVASYRESFKEELVHFHDCVTKGTQPVTSGRDALHDIALCESVVAVHRSRTAREHPSVPAVGAAR